MISTRLQNVCKNAERIMICKPVRIHRERLTLMETFLDQTFMMATLGFTVSCFIIAKYETDRNCSWFAKFRSLRETNTIKNEKKICSSCFAKRKKYKNTKKTCLELFGENKNRKQCFEMFTF